MAKAYGLFGRTWTPPQLVPELEQHFADYSKLLPDGRAFVGSLGCDGVPANFSAVRARALEKAGLSGVHVHDLRHTETTSLRRDQAFGVGADDGNRTRTISLGS